MGLLSGPGSQGGFPLKCLNLKKPLEYEKKVRDKNMVSQTYPSYVSKRDPPFNGDNIPP